MLKALLLFFYSLGKSSKTVAKDKGKKKKKKTKIWLKVHVR